MEETPDNVLAETAAAGDGDSFTELCRRYYPAMVAIAHAILGDRHLAEDAAQQAFARAAMNLARLRKSEQFGSWLAAICRNAAFDIGRARRGSGRSEERVAVTHRRQKIRFARAARLAIAAAIVGAAALALIVTRPQANDRPGSSSPPHRDKASADVTFLSLRTAYRQGGEEALNRQLDTAQETLGPWPDRSSLRDLWDDIRS